MDDDRLIATLVDSFASEAREIGQRITSHILALEHGDVLDENVRRAHYDELARGLHTLKGNADTFGFPRLAELAHKLEDVIERFRAPQSAIPHATTDLLLRSIDAFMAQLTPADRRASPLPPLEDLFEALASVDDEPARPGAARAAAGSVEAREGVTDDWRVGPRHVDALLHEIERLRQLRLRLDEQRREVERGLRILQRRSSDTVEVRTILGTLARVLGIEADDVGDVVDSLEQELRSIATMPLRSILDPLQRATRDLSRNLGKEVRLACVGAELSLDRRQLEELKGPLVHLVRNAIDHGIESPDDRVAAGKHREGTITVRVERAGNMVFIEVEDDGAGIDPERIRSEAVNRGVLSPEEAATTAEGDLHQLLFRTGFSTRAEVSEISGRGIGLDVVRTAIQAQGGHLELHTAVGSGSRFVLSLPATIGSTPLLIVRAAEQVFGIPLGAVETIRAAELDHVRIGRTSARFEHAGQLLPLVDLTCMLGLRPPTTTRSRQPVLIVNARSTLVAVLVDELLGNRDLVVRALPQELLGLRAYQGVATQARGDLLLVVQPAFFVEAQTATAKPHDPTRRALVVDDSIAARALHRAILESAGYQVHAVSSARQALDNLRHAYYDVLISDVMMADIDGVQLTTTVRGREETRSLPIILVSSHDAATERARGLAAGADAFLSKRDCISGRLLTEVATAISHRERSK